jgi:chromosome segregation ATPase
MKEITNLTDDFNRKQKILEERDAILNSTRQAKRVADKKVEDILQKSKLELQLAYQKNLDLTSMNAHLQIESKELKRKREVMKAEFRRVTKEKDAAFVFVEKVNKLAEESAQLADERKVANGLLQTNITQLKSELTAFESQIDELKKEKSVLLCNASTWEITEKLLRNEIVHLKSTIGTQNETLSSTMSELERIKQDDSFLKISLESVKATLTEKERENKELTSRNLDLESDKSLLELDNDNLKKEAEDCREELERLKQENQKLLDTQEETLSSVQKSTKLAKEQVEALSEALAAMQEATKHIQNAAKATKTEGES